jgi:hypothetical protein
LDTFSVGYHLFAKSLLSSDVAVAYEEDHFKTIGAQPQSDLLVKAYRTTSCSALPTIGHIAQLLVPGCQKKTATLHCTNPRNTSKTPSDIL